MANYLVKKSNVPTIRSVWLEGLRPLRCWKPRYTKNKEEAKHSKGCLTTYNSFSVVRGFEASEVMETSTHKEQRGYAKHSKG